MAHWTKLSYTPVLQYLLYFLPKKYMIINWIATGFVSALYSASVRVADLATHLFVFCQF